MELSVDYLPTLFKLMSDALSQDENLRKTADATLSNLESRPGFCSCLLVSASIHILRANQSVDLSILLRHKYMCLAN